MRWRGWPVARPGGASWPGSWVISPTPVPPCTPATCGACYGPDEWSVVSFCGAPGEQIVALRYSLSLHEELDTMNWEAYSAAFAPDNNRRALYILNTNTGDWQHLLDFLNGGRYPLIYELDGRDLPPPLTAKP